MDEGKQRVKIVWGDKYKEFETKFKEFETKFKEFETKFKTWLAKQSLPVQAAVQAAVGALEGAAIGGFMGTLTNNVSSAFTPPTPPGAALNPQARASLQQAQALSGGPMIQARNFAVMTGVNAGISCVMRDLRGKEDVQTSMVAAFGSGVMFSLVSGMGGPNQAANVISSGVFFALMQGGLYKLAELTEKMAKIEEEAKEREKLYRGQLENVKKRNKELEAKQVRQATQLAKIEEEVKEAKEREMRYRIEKKRNEEQGWQATQVTETS